MPLRIPADPSWKLAWYSVCLQRVLYQTVIYFEIADDGPPLPHTVDSVATTYEGFALVDPNTGSFDSVGPNNQPMSWENEKEFKQAMQAKAVRARAARKRERR